MKIILQWEWFYYKFIGNEITTKLLRKLFHNNKFLIANHRWSDENRCFLFHLTGNHDCCIDLYALFFLNSVELFLPFQLKELDWRLKWFTEIEATFIGKDFADYVLFRSGRAQENGCPLYVSKLYLEICRVWCTSSLSLFPRRFISHCISKTVDNYQWGVVVIKLFYLQTNTVFCVFLTFSHGKVTTGSNWNLMSSATFICPLEIWWYKCLCDAVLW